jgi:hypothetical protein
MEFIAFVIAMAVAFQAMKGYTLAKERTLLYLNFSFLLLGAGLLVDGLANLIVLLSRFHRNLVYISRLGYTIDFIAQLIAYLILVVVYLQQTHVWSQSTLAVLPIALLETNPFTELILIFLLVYISAQTMINYNVKKSTNSLLVFGAFVSLAFAHVFFLLFVISPIFFPFAHILQLFGFLLLLGMLFRVNQTQ